MPAPVGAEERANIMGMFADGPPATSAMSANQAPDFSWITAGNAPANPYANLSMAGGVQLAAGPGYNGGVDSNRLSLDMLNPSDKAPTGGSLRGMTNEELLATGNAMLAGGDSSMPLGGPVVDTGITLRQINISASAEDDGSYDASEAARLSNYPAPNGAYAGTITNLAPTFWERTWLSPEVQHVMGNSITGKLVGGVANTLGTAWASFASRDGYNPATGKNLNLVQQRDGRIDTLINAAATVVTGGANTATKAEVQAMKTEMATAQASRRAELHAKFGRSGNLDQDINARGASSLRSEVDRLAAEGHAVGRHGERVTETAIDNRALNKFDPITGSTTDYVTGGTHRVGTTASQFTENRALLDAEAYVRGSPEFASAQANAVRNLDDQFAVKGLRLEDALGPNYLSQVFGKTRTGPVGTGTLAPTNFTDGTITGIFRQSPTGNWNLHTMYPNPKP